MEKPALVEVLSSEKILLHSNDKKNTAALISRVSIFLIYWKDEVLQLALSADAAVVIEYFFIIDSIHDR